MGNRLPTFVLSFKCWPAMAASSLFRLLTLLFRSPMDAINSLHLIKASLFASS